MLTEACSCRLELAYFAGKISKNRLVCKKTVALAYYGSCRLLVIGSWIRLWVFEACFTEITSSKIERSFGFD